MISIIVPVYKAEKYIRECAESVISQSYTDWELILVDDGSPDESGRICDELSMEDQRIRVVHKSNGGAASARNVGLELAKGDFISFLDSDDMLTHDSLAVLLEWHKRTTVDIVCGRLDVYYKTHPFKAEKVNYYNAEESISAMFLRETDFSQCAKLYKREIIGDIRFPEGRTNEDAVFLFRIYQRCAKILYISNIVYSFRINKNSVTHSMKNHYSDIYYNVNLMEHDVNKMSLLVKNAFKVYKAKVCMDLCFYFKKYHIVEEYSQEYKECRNFCKNNATFIFFSGMFTYKYKLKYILILL